MLLEDQVSEVLKNYKGLRIVDNFDDNITLIGSLHFSANYPQKKQINDSYLIKLVVDYQFPNITPIVYELEERIPRIADRHVFSDGRICLGSPLRLKIIYSKNPTIRGFIEMCVIPFLYANSYYEENKEYPWGDLAHGYSAVIEDYLDIFKLTNKAKLIQALKILTASNFNAKKMRCPCGCNKRFKQCTYSEHLLDIKAVATKAFFKSQLKKCIENKIAIKV